MRVQFLLPGCLSKKCLARGLVYGLCIYLNFLCVLIPLKVIIRDNLGQVDGLAVEWESELIYWTDYLYERLEVARVDGSSRRTLFTSELYNPRGIAVDPKSG